MLIIIKTEEDSIDYQIKALDDKTTNDEICRAITHLELIKQELMKNLEYDYEVFENED